MANRLRVWQTGIATVYVVREMTIELFDEMDEPSDEESAALLDQESWTIETPDEDVWNIEVIDTESEIIDEGKEDRIVWTDEWRPDEEGIAHTSEDSNADDSLSFGNEDDKAGFVLLSPLIDTPQPGPVVTAPAHQYSDEMIAANSRKDWGTHVAEPIYKEGKATGEWRVARLRTPSDRPGKTVAWSVVPDE